MSRDQKILFVTGRFLLQLNHAQTDFKGLTNSICYRRNKGNNKGNKRKYIEGTKD